MPPRATRQGPEDVLLVDVLVLMEGNAIVHLAQALASPSGEHCAPVSGSVWQRVNPLLLELGALNRQTSAQPETTDRRRWKP